MLNHVTKVNQDFQGALNTKTFPILLEKKELKILKCDQKLPLLRKIIETSMQVMCVPSKTLPQAC
ncbi:hypothetical protein APR51_25355 [Variovorax paradoxus]|nr:hypothetical protein APR52_37385 [Variovorax paradoxus]KPV17938.1 hypothetical protein APR51_25355 [Variovorax paradoxus]